MHERSLLERLERPERQSRRRLRLDSSELLESVLGHLRHLFNARRGSVMTRTDYGMPDFNDLAMQFPDAVPVIARAIKYQIDHFEPRIAKCAVRHVPNPDDPLSFSFHITGELKIGDDAERVTFETVMGDDGQMRVRM